MGRRRALGNPDLCRSYIRAQLRQFKAPAGHRLVLCKLKVDSKEMSTTRCGQYAICVRSVRGRREKIAAAAQRLKSKV